MCRANQAWVVELMKSLETKCRPMEVHSVVSLIRHSPMIMIHHIFMKIWETFQVCIQFSLHCIAFKLTKIPFQCIAAQRISSNIPPPLPAKPKQSIYSQIGGDISGTYVQPQAILPPSYRQQQSPTHAVSPKKTYGSIDAVGATKIQYANPRANIANQSISSSFEYQKHPLVIL